MNYLLNYENSINQWLDTIFVDPDITPFDVYDPEGLCVNSYVNIHHLRSGLWNDFCVLNALDVETPIRIDEQTRNLHIHRRNFHFTVEPSRFWLEDDTTFDMMTTGQLANWLINEPPNELKQFLEGWEQDPKKAPRNRIERIREFTRCSSGPSPFMLIGSDSMPWLKATDTNAWAILYWPQYDPLKDDGLNLASPMCWMPQGKYDQGGWWKPLPNKTLREVWAQIDEYPVDIVKTIIANDDRSGRFLNPNRVDARLSGEMIGENFMSYNYLARVFAGCSAEDMEKLFFNSLQIY